MQTKKMSLANIQGKLNRTEMKKIMAGSGTLCGNYNDPCYTLATWGTYSCCASLGCYATGGETTGFCTYH